jgi:hypothetical protein
MNRSIRGMGSSRSWDEDEPHSIGVNVANEALEKRTERKVEWNGVEQG